MKLRDGILLVVLVLIFVILAYLLSSKNPKRSLAPILVPIRGWFGGNSQPQQQQQQQAVVVVSDGSSNSGDGNDNGGTNSSAPELPGPITTPSATPPPSVGAFSLMYN